MRSVSPTPSFSSLAALVVCTLGAVCSLPRAAAADTGVAVLGLDVLDVPEHAAQALTDALRERAAGQAGVRLLPGKDLVEVKLVFGCMEEKPACLAQAGRSLGADRLIYGSVRRPTDSAGYAVVLKQLDVHGGRVEKFVSDVVPARLFHKGSTELAQAAQKWLGVLLFSTLRGSAQITSNPAGAAVTIDGNHVGRTPLDLHELDAGSHVAVIALDGYEQVVQAFTVRGGMVHEMRVAMARRGARPSAAQGGQETQGQVQAGQGQVQAGQGQVQAGQGAQPVLTAPRPPAPEEHDRGKALRIGAYFLVGAAALAGGVAIYTWRTYTSEQDPARQALDVLQMNVPASSDVNDFFHSPDRLSSCEPPTELTLQAKTTPLTTTAYNDYLDHCRRGRSYAGATTGLVATMGSLALLGVITYIIGERLGHPERKSSPDDAYKKRASLKGQPWLYQPRLTAVSPVVSATGGGLNLNIQF